MMIGWENEDKDAYQAQLKSNFLSLLSLARAEAVVKTLVKKYKVIQNRLSSYGVGPLVPVSSNEIEEGRALNRRVELVKE